MINYNIILDRANALLKAIDNNYLGELWDTDLENAHASVSYHGISDEIITLKDAIKTVQKSIYDEDARNHPVWKETQINPYHNRSNSPFQFIDGDYDMDAGYEDWKVWWDSEEIFLYVRIGWTHDDGRDWGDVEVHNWKSEEDTIKWLRNRDVDEDNEHTNEFILNEAHGLQEIVQFNDGYLINEEKVKVV